jgi:hypothetical protein
MVDFLKKTTFLTPIALRNLAINGVTYGWSKTGGKLDANYS